MTMPFERISAESIGKQLRALRKSRGLTQTFLAKQTGAHHVTLCAYEAGTRKPSLEMLTRILTVFNEPLESFLRGLESESKDHLKAESPGENLSLFDALPLVSSPVLKTLSRSRSRPQEPDIREHSIELRFESSESVLRCTDLGIEIRGTLSPSPSAQEIGEAIQLLWAAMKSKQPDPRFKC